MTKQKLFCGIVLLVAIMFCIAACEKKNEEKVETEHVIEEQNDERIDAAEGTGVPTLVVSDVRGKTGDIVNVAVTLVNNPGILGMSLTLSYDENILTLKEVKNGNAFSECLTMSSSAELSSGCVFLWDGESISEQDIKDGSILNMSFEVNKNQLEKSAKSDIVLTSDIGGTVDNDLNPIEIVIDNGYFTLSN